MYITQLGGALFSESISMNSLPLWVAIFYSNRQTNNWFRQCLWFIYDFLMFHQICLGSS